MEMEACSACHERDALESAAHVEETNMALWDEPRGSRGPRAEGSALCMMVTIGGLVAAAVALKWLIALI